jgi:putative Ca2+/H+ antiporter (TMEM165/GDT1 family)
MLEIKNSPMIDSVNTEINSLEVETVNDDKSSWWGVFFSTFVTIFCAEMGDKTQIATMLMTAESQSPWVIFVGAGTALIATSLVGILLGRWLAKHLSPKVIDLSAAILLSIISISLIFDVLTNT